MSAANISGELQTETLVEVPLPGEAWCPRKGH